MFQRIGDFFRRLMEGRNGVDTLAWVSLVLGVLVNLLGSVLGLSIFVLLADVFLIYALWRTFSRNIERRYAENQRFCQFFARIRGRKTYRYFRCPACKTQVRVPRGKGKIRITCPSCRECFIKKT